VINSHAETKREAVTLFMWLYVLLYQKHFFSWENLTMDWTKQSNFRIDPFSILTYTQVIKIVYQKRHLISNSKGFVMRLKGLAARIENYF